MGLHVYQSVHSVFKKCGRSSCWCASSEKGHGPYIVVCGRTADGRRTQRHVKKAMEFEEIRNQIQDRKLRKKTEKELKEQCQKADQRRRLVIQPILDFLHLYFDHGRIRERRSIAPEERWRRRYLLLSEEWKSRLTCKQFVSLCRGEVSARQRCNRLRIRWDPDLYWAEALAKIEGFELPDSQDGALPHRKVPDSLDGALPKLPD